MITNNDLSSINLSATNKDYYQIWGELLELADKISERWSPTATNESDPGIVLLKVLTALGDKLNYNIDKNILEAFMPSAAQMESMRKLCSMMGYNMKYNQSAETEVTISYTGDTTDTENDSTAAILAKYGYLEIPMFMTVSNLDGDVNYFVAEQGKVLSASSTIQKVTCIEGQPVKCETENDNIISLAQLDDNNRYYLPEIQIAENGIFVFRINDGARSRWAQVDNLNIQQAGAQVYKFGYDSREARPYIQFPDDISQIIEDGFEIYYTRTNGVNGNVSANTLTTFTMPDEWEEFTDGNGNSISVNTETLYINNPSAARNGADLESITEAYNGYKKTVGTFDTLVTCRDYMNKIYQLMDESDNTPYVSNVIVSDIRDDINRAITLCTFNDFGICYTEQAIKENNKDLISHFDLMLYPFKTVYGLNNKTEHDESFKYTGKRFNEITAKLKDSKTISHNFRLPENTETKKDIVCIKNYLDLNATITTVSKVNAAAEKIILANIYAALYENFNLRKLDFGEEIPFDSILKVIENADKNIKNVSLQEPKLSTVFELADGTEIAVNSMYDTSDADNEKAFEIYSKLTLRNILAGRVELLKYNTEFKYDLFEESYSKTNSSIKSIYPSTDYALKKIVTECSIDTSKITGSEECVLQNTESIKFRAPNFKTTVTYPAYVNYYLDSDNPIFKEVTGVAAKFMTLFDFLTAQKGTGEGKWHEDVPTQIDNTNFVTVNNFVKGKVYSTDSSGNGEAYYKGIFYKGSAAAENKPGYLIDENGTKYIQLKSVTNTQKRDSKELYVQSAEANDKTGGLGMDGTSGYIPKNSEYELTGNDVLFINYTPAATTSTDDEGNIVTTEASGAKYIEYTKDDNIIIRPNFDLTSSNNNSATKSKTTGLEGFTRPEVKEGMYTLGVNEQIEIVEQVVIRLEDNPTYLFWNIDEAAHGYAENTLGTGKDTEQLVLNDNEYLYYTDKNKSSMAYYGSGTVIDLYKIMVKKLDTEMSAEDVLSNGISAIPWVSQYLNSKESHILIKEYKYQTLAEGDELINVTFNDNNASTVINNDWRRVSNATMQYATEDAPVTLPTMNVSDCYWEVRSTLEFDSSSNQSMLVSGSNSGRASGLITNKIDLYGVGADGKTLEVKETIGGSGSTALTDTLSIKTNYIVQSGEDTISTSVTKENEDGEKVSVDDFKIKTYKKSDIGLFEFDRIADTTIPKIVETTIQPISLHNFSNTDGNGVWTSVDLSDKQSGNDTPKGIRLFVNIPEKQFAPNKNRYYGTMLIYCTNVPEDASTEDGSLPSILLVNKTTESDTTIDYDNSVTIFNYVAGSATTTDSIEGWKWWDGQKKLEAINIEGKTSTEAGTGPYGVRYYLKPGVNIVKFNNSGILYILPDNKKVTSEEGVVSFKYPESSIIFSDIDIVDRLGDGETNTHGIDVDTLGLNPSLADDILEQLRNLDQDNQFYYNLLLDNSSAININKNLTGDNKETLATPRMWYDYNNINNKFVISEINSKTLSSGIAISKSSKL